MLLVFVLIDRYVRGSECLFGRVLILFIDDPSLTSLSLCVGRCDCICQSFIA